MTDAELAAIRERVNNSGGSDFGFAAIDRRALLDELDAIRKENSTLRAKLGVIRKIYFLKPDGWDDIIRAAIREGRS